MLVIFYDFVIVRVYFVYLPERNKSIPTRPYFRGFLPCCFTFCVQRALNLETCLEGIKNIEWDFSHLNVIHRALNAVHRVLNTSRSTAVPDNYDVWFCPISPHLTVILVYCKKALVHPLWFYYKCGPHFDDNLWLMDTTLRFYKLCVIHYWEQNGWILFVLGPELVLRELNQTSAQGGIQIRLSP